MGLVHVLLFSLQKLQILRVHHFNNDLQLGVALFDGLVNEETLGVFVCVARLPRRLGGSEDDGFRGHLDLGAEEGLVLEGGALDDNYFREFAEDGFHFLGGLVFG